jgi:hypothetical protein
LLSSIIIFTLLYSPLLTIQLNLLFYCRTILFTLLCFPLCATPLSFSHCYVFLCIILFSFSCCWAFLFILLYSPFRITKFSCSCYFVLLFTMLCFPLCTTPFSSLCHLALFCIVLLSFSHCSAFLFILLSSLITFVF